MTGYIKREATGELYLHTPLGQLLLLPKSSYDTLTHEDGTVPVYFYIKPKTGKFKRKFGVVKV